MNFITADIATMAISAFYTFILFGHCKSVENMVVYRLTNSDLLYTCCKWFGYQHKGAPIGHDRPGTEKT